MLKLEIALSLAALAVVSCSGITNRTVSETAVESGEAGERPTSLAEGGRAGSTAQGAGAPGNGGFAAMPPFGGMAASGGALPSGGAGGHASCPPTPNPVPMHAVSSWEYRQRVLELTTKETSVELPPDPVTQPPFAFSMAMNDLAIQALFTEAETQAGLADVQGLMHCDAPNDPACVSAFVDKFVGGAFRRPLTDAEHARYLALYEHGEAGGAPGGLQLLVNATLFSPLFLFKTYLGSPQQVGPGRSDLTAYELAGRLASLFRGGGLDPKLWSEAANGSLETDDGVARLANGLLHDPRYGGVVQRFHAQWLGLDDLPAARPDLGPALLGSMRRETELFITDVFNGDRLLSSLLLSHGTWVDARLSSRYQLPPPKSDFVRVELDTTRYFGLLTQSSTLAHFSNPSERGLFVLERLQCGAVPPMPPGIPGSVTVSPMQTDRDAWMQAMTDASCRGCHSRFDMIGFGFGHFDRDGLYRESQNGLPIDASGSLDNGATFTDLNQLAQKLAGDPAVADCVAKTWLSYALERPVTDSDACAVQQIDRAFMGSHFNFDALVTAIALSSPFRTRDGYAIPPALPPAMPVLSGSAQDLNQRRKLLLDFSVAEAQWLGKLVPPQDAPIVDQYLDVVRGLEVKLSQLGGGPGPAP
jgi:hypothetical protein